MAEEVENTNVEDSKIESTESVEKLVEFSRKISEQEMTIASQKQDITNIKNENDKLKADIIRLQKVIADNFICTTDKNGKYDMPTPTSFQDAYKTLIEQNSNKQ